jgi:hypothetical protein
VITYALFGVRHCMIDGREKGIVWSTAFDLTVSKSSAVLGPGCI